MTAANWALQNFIEALDRWIDLDGPNTDLRLIVSSWVFSRVDDPYRGVRRQPGFDNLWWGPVPGSEHPPSRVVVCSYWIIEQQRAVRCDQINSLSLPV